MTKRLVRSALVAASLALLIPLAGPAQADRSQSDHDTVRFSTFNASLNRNVAGQLRADLSTPGNAQAIHSSL